MTDRYATLRNGLVGAWCPSLGATGWRIVDRSPYRRDATLSGSPVWSAGAIDLSAASTYAQITHSSLYNAGRAGLTVSAWFTASTTSLSFPDVIASKVQGGAPYYAFSIQGAGTGALSFVMSNASGNDFFASVSGIAANRFYHFAGTFDGQTLRPYLNGVLGNAATLTGTASTNTADVRISDTAGYNNRQWPGLIDDVRIYQRCLSPSEVLLLATRPGVGLLPTRHRRANALGSRFHLNVGGTWKAATPWIKVGGVWTKATPKIRVSGAYK